MYLEDHIKRAQHTGIMRTKLKVGYEMTTLLMAGCRIYFGQKRVCSFLTYGILNSFKLDSRMWDEKWKTTRH